MYATIAVGILSLMSEDKLGEAYEANKSLIATLDRSSRNYAVQAYWQGQICDQRGNAEEAIHWFVESALCDVQEAIKDNASLSTLAAILLDISETDRAFRYIRFSLEDASFYNAKLRKVQIATTFPMIEKAYNAGKIDFKKPISCHLYPVRLNKVGDMIGVEYHRWDICHCARVLGKKLHLPIYQFLKEPLIRRFGQEWYDELSLVASEWQKQVKG